MKKTITFSFLLLVYLIAAEVTFSQTILTSTMTPPPAGTSDSIYIAYASISPGGGGASQTWDISGLAAVPEGLAFYVDAATSPYISAFPTANICTKITPIAGPALYGYERISATGWEELATNYSGSGTGTDYTPNPESNLEFPFNYLDSFTDAFQQTGHGSSNVTITYDGYGTLITPFATYTNVVRIRKYWGVGDYDYNWYVTSPYLGIVASYDNQNTRYTLTKTVSQTGVNETKKNECSAMIFPNPLRSQAVIQTNIPGGIKDAKLIISDITGRVVRTIPICGENTTIQKDGLLPGMYIYQVFNNNFFIAKGKLIVQ